LPAPKKRLYGVFFGAEGIEPAGAGLTTSERRAKERRLR